MSTAHRPTWDPAQAKEVKGGSRQFSVRDMASQTKLKFRQPGQTSTAEVAKKDLRAELLRAEKEARDRKRKAAGLPVEEEPTPSQQAIESEDANKRRKMLNEAVELDRDDDDEDSKRKGDEDEEGEEGEANGNENAMDVDGDDSDDSDDSDEDDTAELLRELEKIKRERAEEKARQERELSASETQAREAEIALGNPLLNLSAALGQQPTSKGTGVAGTFTVKKRWDDDLIFKNQGMDAEDKPKGQFVNDLLRTEFHRKFMAKFIK